MVDYSFDVYLVMGYQFMTLSAIVHLLSVQFSFQHTSYVSSRSPG